MKSNAVQRSYAGGVVGACIVGIVAGTVAAIVTWFAHQSALIAIAAYSVVGFTALLLCSIARSLWLARTKTVNHRIARPILPQVKKDVDEKHGVALTNWRQINSAMDDLAMFVGPTDVGSNNLEVVEALGSAGFCVNVTNDLEHGLGSIAEQRNRWSLLVVDIDAFDKCDGLEDLIESLMRVRKSSPSTTTVILSGGFGRDDLTTSRAVLADASIKSPCSPSRLSAALQQAHVNNATWCRSLLQQD
ncbi:MAG: hypothetical protein ACK47C_20085 [Paracoccaceae bacterium]|jgi:hypothetical protein